MVEGWLNSSRWSSARWRLDEQEPVEARGGRRWMNSSSWRLEGVDGGDEQYPVESHFAVRHTPPDEQDPRFDRSAPTQVRFLRFALRHTPLDQQDPRFDRRRSVSSVLRYATPLPINRTPVSTVGGLFPPLCGMPGLVSIAYSVQALPMNTTTHSVPTQPRCLPMNTAHSVASP